MGFFSYIPEHSKNIERIGSYKGRYGVHDGERTELDEDRKRLDHYLLH